MPTTHWAVVKKNKIELPKDLNLPEGTKVLITILSEVDEQEFWSSASLKSIHKIWDNTEDDTYAKLLEK